MGGGTGSIDRIEGSLLEAAAFYFVPGFSFHLARRAVAEHGRNRRTSYLVATACEVVKTAAYALAAVNIYGVDKFAENFLK